MKYYFPFLLSLVLHFHASAQNDSIKSQFSFVGQGGLLFPGYSNWTFYGSTDIVPTHPGPEISIGAQYGPFASIAGTLLNTSLLISFGQLGTGIQTQVPGNAELTIQRMPVLLVCTFETASKLSPCVEIGAGVCKTDFYENYSNPFYPSVHFHNWNFCWANALGLRYRC